MEEKDPELLMLLNDKEDGYKYKERRLNDWRENYTLGRDKVTYNRFTQRQSVNVPVMKTAQKTILAQIDDMPVMFFQNLSNDKLKEILKNEYWKKTLELNKMEIKDYVDKKQEFYFGRTFDQMQIADGIVKWTIIDPHDILSPRYADPANIDSWRFLIHTHIFTPLSIIEANSDYDKDKVRALKEFYGTEAGLIKAKDNNRMLEQKNRTMADMGVSDIDSPILGETYVELTMHFRMHKEGAEEEQFYLYVEADDQQVLMKKPLEEVIGQTKDHFWRTHLPYNSWADDLENQDVWSDGNADIIRTPNKVLNSWLSQLVENRTLRNFGMNFYDTTIEGFVPPSVQPAPGAWIGLPGKPSDIYHKVDIPDLSESLDEMQFLQTLVEKATGATETQQGVVTDQKRTLGEVQLAIGQAKQRTGGISKFYTQCWKERATKFDMLIEAAADKLDSITVYKEGRNSQDMYTREVSPKDFVDDKGYTCQVWAQNDKNEADARKIDRLNILKQNMPDNPIVDEVFKRKLAEFSDLTPDEIKRIMDFEEQKRQAIMAGQMMMSQPAQPIQQQPVQQPNPVGAPLQ